ncbi:MAG: 6-phosphogluconolactonase/glucose-6-phosphate isomerase [Actinomycetota bacterium]
MPSNFSVELANLAAAVAPLRELFEHDTRRHEWLAFDVCGIHADFSRQRVDPDVFGALMSLVSDAGVAHKREQMFSGVAINSTENRAVQHVALRSSGSDDTKKDLARRSREAAIELARQIRENTEIDTVINIGIGGSDLGPQMVVRALRKFCNGPTVHFVSNIDPADLDSVIDTADPHRTIVVVSSKTFTTLETMENAARAREWMMSAGVEWSEHCVAVTSSCERAVEWGVKKEHCLEFFDWVGGRFSVSSVIGFAVMLAIGDEHFAEFLDGMHQMDRHFSDSPWERNLPVVHAALWYLNAAVHQYPTVAVIPYSHDLARLPAFLQQLVMESNGKGVTIDGQKVTHATSPVVWGESGTNSQHAFFQMIHQGTQVVPVEFISTVRPMGHDQHTHDLLIANLIAQSEALAAGSQGVSSHQDFPGNRPSSVLLLDELSPRCLGALVAMYEHSVAVQGWLLNVNSFDQFGVELGKDLAKKTAQSIAQGTPDESQTMTHPLMKWFLERRKNFS